MNKRKKSEPWRASPQHSDSRKSEPRKPDSGGPDPKRSEPRKPDSGYRDPKRSGPRKPDSGYRDPKRSGPPRQSSGYSHQRRAEPPKLDPIYRDPKDAGSRKTDSRFPEPKRSGPPRQNSGYSSYRRAEPPKVDPIYRDPKDAGSRRPDSRFPDPNRSGPRKPDSRYSDPNRSGPRRPDSRYHDPKRSGPRKPDSRYADPNRSGPPKHDFRQAEPPAPEPVIPEPAETQEAGPNMISGRIPVLEALRAGTTMIEKVIILAGVKGEGIERIRTLAKKNRVICVEVGKQKFRELASDSLTQGVVAMVGIKEYVDIVDILAIAEKKNEPPCLLILDEIEDPHNLGALIRTAECAGIHGVVIPKHHAATVNQTVAKTSAGASEHLPVAKVVNIAQTIDALKKEGIWIVGTDESAEQAFTKVDYKMPVAIVIGNEGKGIRQLVKEKCDFLVKIPLFGKIESLNASVAGALVMFEMVKQRKAL